MSGWMNDRTELTWQIREIQIFYIMNITLGRNLPHPTSVGPMKAASFIFTPTMVGIECGTK